MEAFSRVLRKPLLEILFKIQNLVGNNS